jgi:hypothetical protein
MRQLREQVERAKSFRAADNVSGDADRANLLRLPDILA